MTKLLNDEVFGHNIQQLRRSRGLTQMEMVAKMQLLGSPISRSTYSLIELGRGNIYVSDLVALKLALDVDYATFFEGISSER